MKNIPKPTDKISLKAMTVWRIHDGIFYIITLLILGTLLLAVAYYHWFDWIRIALYIISGIVILKAIYTLTIYPILLHKTWRYQIHQDYIQTRHGFFHTSQTIIPMSRVEYVDTNDGPILRKFGLANMTIGTRTSSVNIPAILKSEAIRIRTLIRNNDSKNILENEGTKPTMHYNMSWKEIIFVSITSLYIVAVFPMIALAFLKLVDILSLEFYTDRVTEILTEPWLLLAIGLGGMTMIAIASSIAFVYFTYGKYQVSSDKAHIYISKGSSNKIHITIPRTSINGILIEKPMTRRLFRIVKIKLIYLHEHTGGEKHALFPFIQERRGIQLLEDILPEYEVHPPSSSLPNEAYFVALIQPSYLLVIVTFHIMFFSPEYWFIPIVYALFLVVKRIVKTKQQRYGWTDELVSMQTGSFSTEIIMTKREKIDALDIDQSWLQGQLGLASITITSRAKPIQVTVMDHVAEDVATNFYNWYIRYPDD